MAPKCPVPKRHGAELSSAESAAPSRRCRNGGAEMALPQILDSVNFINFIEVEQKISHDCSVRELYKLPRRRTKNLTRS